MKQEVKATFKTFCQKTRNIFSSLSPSSRLELCPEGAYLKNRPKSPAERLMAGRELVHKIKKLMHKPVNMAAAGSPESYQQHVKAKEDANSGRSFWDEPGEKYEFDGSSNDDKPGYSKVGSSGSYKQHLEAEKRSKNTSFWNFR